MWDIVKSYISLLRFNYHQNFSVVIIGALVGQPFMISTLISLLRLYVSFNIFLYGAIYTFNGLTNAHLDALHPEKRNRPIASGDISVPHASVLTLTLFVLAQRSAYRWFGFRANIVYFLFTIVNALYSLHFRYIPKVRVWFSALMCPMRLFLGATVFRTSPGFSLYLLSYLFMVALQSSKVRLESRGVHSFIIEGACLCATSLTLLYTFVSHPWISLFWAVYNIFFNLLPIFNVRVIELLLGMFTLDCQRRRRHN